MLPSSANREPGQMTAALDRANARRGITASVASENERSMPTKPVQDAVFCSYVGTPVASEMPGKAPIKVDAF